MGELLYMDYSLFQKLTESELDNYLSEMDLALEFHVKWLSDLNRALICQSDSHFEQLQKLLATDDHFTRWYNSAKDEDLAETPYFINLGDMHNKMLLHAQRLLTKASKNEIIPTLDYDEFILLTSSFRQQINKLKSKVKSDLRLVAKLMGKVFENAEEGVMITDADSNILNVNNSFEKVTQYSRDEVIGKKPSLLHSGNHDNGFYRRMWEIIVREHRWHGEIWNRRKNNELYPEWLSITAVLDDSNTVSHYIGIFSDVSTENEGNERLYHLAHYDSLCNLPNRMLFYDRLRQAVSRIKRSDKQIAVIFMDLDGFKAVNDDYGHSIGDELLQHVSKRVVSMLRESDTLARIGGDEFTLIINDVENIDSLKIIATKILSIIQEPYTLHGNTFTVSASIGISLLPDDTEDMNTLVKQADIAMYKAKKEGKNRFKFYDATMG